MGEISIGTAGYDYPGWAGAFYPAALARSDYFRYYAGRFKLLELNCTAYRTPGADELRRWLEEAPSGMSFAAKAPEELTSRADPSAWRAKAAEFRAALAPLAAAGRLAAVLLRFPESFEYTAERRRYLDAVLNALAGWPLAVEFRRADWYNNRVFAALAGRSVALAAVDRPDLPGLPPDCDLALGPLAYLRLHGRNAAGWWGSSAAERYDYSYTDAELAAWVVRAQALASRADRLLVVFNNYPRGQAAVDAGRFRRLAVAAGLVPFDAGFTAAFPASRGVGAEARAEGATSAAAAP